VLDPGQVLHTEPPDKVLGTYPIDTTDFSPAVESGSTPLEQGDALASDIDAFSREVVDNDADLLVSRASDVAEGAVYAEEPNGLTSTAFDHEDLNALDKPALELNDLDGLELWGPVGMDDALLFSRFDDLSSGTSIFKFSGGTAVPLHLSFSSTAATPGTLPLQWASPSASSRRRSTHSRRVLPPLYSWCPCWGHGA
jgi:hypothetical protein